MRFFSSARLAVGLGVSVVALMAAQVARAEETRIGPLTFDVPQSESVEDHPPKKVFHPPTYRDFEILGNTAEEIYYATTPQGFAIARDRLAARAQRSCQLLGFRHARYVDTGPIGEVDAELPQLISMERNGVAVLATFHLVGDGYGGVFHPTFMSNLECSD